MSDPKSINSIERQLADLQMTSDVLRGKKTPPAVPPKKKAQPQVPHSAMVNTLREPSYSSRISPNNNVATYSNVHPGSMLHSVKDHKHVGLANQKPPQDANANSYSSPYSNLPPYRRTADELPPPPPPPPHNAQQHKYSARNVEEYLPAPPSPVSSNYSELARATSNLNYNPDGNNFGHIYQNDFNVYGASQASNYESLYEPINPRPHSNLSAQMSSSLINRNNNTVTKYPMSKEKEVDDLTNLLVKSISNSQDLDVFGICIKCKEKVIGETSGCTAMGFMYHVKCFSCHVCDTNLQGKPFYAVEGQPYCEVDYFETLEKCSVCEKPILDRILRATGKPYHPACFTCVVCGKSLDGIPFTVDAMNMIHCIEDFHKKFAPRCCVCQLPIMPEEGEEETVRVVALDRSFHVRCYRCEDCGLILSSEAEGRGCYPLDGHILCKTCNAHRIRLLTNVMTTDL